MGMFIASPLEDLVLRGPRLTLRPWHPSDAERVVEVMRHDSLHEFLPLPRPYTRADADAFLLETAAEGRRDATVLACAVVETDGGRLVGSCSMRLARDNDIGYWVAPDARGHGYAAEATRTLAEWAFAAGSERVQVRADPRNAASVHTALASGFGFEGVSRAVAPKHPIAGPDGSTRPGDLARFARLAGDPGTPVAFRLAPLPRAGIGDGVLRLRTTVAADAPGMVETDDAETLRWNFDGRATPPERLYRACADAGLNWLVDRVAMMTMVDVADDRLAGALTVRTSGPARVGSIGYVVHPAYRGRGYTTRALRLLSGWAFEQAGLARLELGTKPGNLASQRAARNAGFEPEGRLAARLAAPDGSYHDEVRFALLNPRYPRVS